MALATATAAGWDTRKSWTRAAAALAWATQAPIEGPSK
jgi:hypothetical protein